MILGDYMLPGTFLAISWFRVFSTPETASWHLWPDEDILRSPIYCITFLLSANVFIYPISAYFSVSLKFTVLVPFLNNKYPGIYSIPNIQNL